MRNVILVLLSFVSKIFLKLLLGARVSNAIRLRWKGNYRPALLPESKLARCNIAINETGLWYDHSLASDNLRLRVSWLPKHPSLYR